jgi:hypothetical protein
MNLKNQQLRSWARSLAHALLISALGILATSLYTGTAQADTMGVTGSISLPAAGVTIDGPNLNQSTMITPTGVTAHGGTDDFTVIPDGTPVTSSVLNLMDLTAYTFTISGFGSWATTSGSFDTTPNGRHLTVDLVGIFTPTFGAFMPTPDEVSISVNQTGAALSWAQTLHATPIPEPTTAGLMALAVLVGTGLLFRKLVLRSC